MSKNRSDTDELSKLANKKDPESREVSHYQELINALKQVNKGEIKIYDK